MDRPRYDAEFPDFMKALGQLASSDTSTRPNSKARRCRVRLSNVPVFDKVEVLVNYLEGVVGKDSIVHCRLRHPSEATRADQVCGPAFVHFKSEAYADVCCELGRTKKLVFQGRKLFVRLGYNDREGAMASNIENDDGSTDLKNSTVTQTIHTTLYLGSLLRPDHMYVLDVWSPVSVETNDKSKCLRILYCYHTKIYKLEWLYRAFNDISKHTVENQGSHFLLKVWMAPRVFELVVGGAEYYSDDAYDYTSQLHIRMLWGRTTDFTDGASIAQSFTYCIKLPHNYENMNILECMIQEGDQRAMDEENYLLLSHGPSYSYKQSNAPILDSPQLNRLPFEVIFAVNSLVQQGYLSGPSLDKDFFQLLEQYQDMAALTSFLETLTRKKETCFEPVRWFRSHVDQFQRQLNTLGSHSLNLSKEGLVHIRRIFVTPSRVYFTGPEIDVSNRVIRHYEDSMENFTRVTFVEEDLDNVSPMTLLLPAGGKLQHDRQGALPSERSKVFERIIHVLNEGIAIGEKKFEFLAFSTSQLREGSVWMFASDGENSAEKIREWMGDFMEIRNVAKCASRMGQSFSSSTKSLDVPGDEVQTILDIYDKNHVYCFSDGIGKISQSFATKVAAKCKMHSGQVIPSCFQIRYGGYKGVVAVDPGSNHKLSLRKSMDKFPSDRIGLDILNWSRPISSYLNRQIITLLSTLGVRDNVFEDMQTRVMQRLDQMLVDREVALDVLRTFCAGDSHGLMVDLLSAGYYPSCEPFLTRMLYAFRALQLMDLRKKTRIFSPKGRLLIGCLDETATLNYGEVFVSVSPMPGNPHRFFSIGLDATAVKGLNGVPRQVCLVEGAVIVTKNPCVHPGDVRVLKAINVPALHHMVDCIVFPQKGPRCTTTKSQIFNASIF